MLEKKKVCREIVTIGLPLPNILEYTPDVSNETRQHLNLLRRYSKDRGIKTHEIKARSINVASNHANIVEKMIGDWVLICGSDHTFAPNALELLLDAAAKPPYPKIIGAIANYRGAPYRWTNAVFDDSGERLYPLVPYYNVDPSLMSSGAVQEIAVVGSGFTLYHRSVFDKVPTPWFTYEPQRPGMPEIEEILRDWDGEMRFDEWLEWLNPNAAGTLEPRNITPADGHRLHEKAKGLRRLLAKFRRPSSVGFDFGICLKAKDYGIKTYIHWGVVVDHLTLEHTNPRRYVHWVESDRNNWRSEVMARNELTSEKIAEFRKIEETADIKRKEWEEAVAEAQEDKSDVGDGTRRDEVGGHGRGEGSGDSHIERESVDTT